MARSTRQPSGPVASATGPRTWARRWLETAAVVVALTSRLSNAMSVREERRFDLTLVRIPRREALQRIASAAGMAIVGAVGDDEAPVSVEVHGATLRAALERVLPGASYILRYGDGAEPFELVVLSPGPAVAVAPTVSEDDEATRRLGTPRRAVVVSSQQAIPGPSAGTSPSPQTDAMLRSLGVAPEARPGLSRVEMLAAAGVTEDAMPADAVQEAAVVEDGTGDGESALPPE